LTDQYGHSSMPQECTNCFRVSEKHDAPPSG